MDLEDEVGITNTLNKYFFKYRLFKALKIQNTGKNAKRVLGQSFGIFFLPCFFYE